MKHFSTAWRVWVLGIMLAFSLVCAPPALSVTSQPTSAELQDGDADSYLSYLLASDILGSGEFRLAQQAIGLDRACALVLPVYKGAFERLQPEWHRLYARLIGATSGPGPLKEGTEVTLQQRQLLIALGLAGNEMINKQSSAVKNLLAEEALKVDDEAIDYKAREREVAEARSKNGSDCELMLGAR